MFAIDLAELFVSIQGESTQAGRPCVFIRLAGCNLECVYCDAVYAAKGKGESAPIGEVVEKALAFGIGFVEVTGGEPLVQPGCGELVTGLLDEGLETMVETNGSVDLSRFDRRARYVVDIKTPGSGAGGSFLVSNFDLLRSVDEVKFVVTSQEDFEWAASLCRERKLTERMPVLFSPAWGMVEPSELARWIIDSRLDVRLNLQIHKFIWGPDAKGV